MVFVTAKQQQQPEQCCHLQLLHGPITAGTIPNEDTAFITCVDPISPPKAVILAVLPNDEWWRRRVPPPGPLCLFHCMFIVIVGEPTPLS